MRFTILANLAKVPYITRFAIITKMTPQYSRGDLNIIEDIVASWDGYQTVNGRLALLKKAFGTDLELLWRIKRMINHEGNAWAVVSNTLHQLSLQGQIPAYIAAFANSLDTTNPEENALKSKLEEIMLKYR